MNTALLLLDFKEKNEDKSEQFKQSMVQAFPNLYKDIYNLNDDDESLDGYDQIVPENQEEFQDINDFLQSLHTMSVDDLVETDNA